MDSRTSKVQQIHRLMSSLFSLTENESKVYLAILSNPNSSPAELANLTELPRTRIYSYTQRLVNRGLIEEVEDIHKVFRSLPVEGIIKKRERELFEEYGEKRVQLRRLSQELQLIWNQLWFDKTPEVHQYVTFEQLMETIAVAKKHVIVTTIPSGGLLPWTEGAYALVKSIRRGVRLFYISLSEDVNKTFMQFMRRLLTESEVQYINTKVVESLPCNIIKVDEDIFILSFDKRPKIIHLLSAELRQTYEYILSKYL